MKAIRRIDDLGRVVIPKQIRMLMDVKDCDEMLLLYDETTNSLIVSKNGDDEVNDILQVEDNEEDIMIRATRENTTKEELLKTFETNGLVGVYNLGLKNMLSYMKSI